ncbi:hypothetical protein PCL_06622 [Purpureocillium lilacinum]|uniref:Uncharacterized protein n=1 Tax=Purpureocillium lilacinum TaxID=33203 RepID=A0A2U3EN89_PURLI|nr:hypothetical protein PCL_06622 [Purpureocillium lilacinum]
MPVRAGNDMAPGRRLPRAAHLLGAPPAATVLILAAARDNMKPLLRQLRKVFGTHKPSPMDDVDPQRRPDILPPWSEAPAHAWVTAKKWSPGAASSPRADKPGVLLCMSNAAGNQSSRRCCSLLKCLAGTGPPKDPTSIFDPATVVSDSVASAKTLQSFSRKLPKRTREPKRAAPPVCYVPKTAEINMLRCHRAIHDKFAEYHAHSPAF